jgi:hypothetical protein
MSFPEILEAVKALPQAEKIQLMHALVDEVGGHRERTTEEAAIAKLFPPGAVLHTGWQATTDEAGMRAIQEALAQIEAKG